METTYGVLKSLSITVIILGQISLVMTMIMQIKYKFFLKKNGRKNSDEPNN